MKHRRNKVKREHGIIQNALPWLENLSRLPEVTDIIPGVIDVNRSSERGIVYKYKTQTGCKLLLKSNGSIQEAFVVTKNPERVQEWVEQEFPSDSPSTSPEVISPNILRDGPKKKPAKVTTKSEVRVNDISYAPLRKHKRKRSDKTISSSSSRAISIDEENLILADHLDNSTVKALQQLKQTLGNSKIKTSLSKGNKFSRS